MACRGRSAWAAGVAVRLLPRHRTRLANTGAALRCVWRRWPPADREAEWHFYLGGRSVPTLYPGTRCYIVAHGRVRGYAVVTGIERYHRGFAIVRRGDGVACTIPEPVRGFQGWRYRGGIARPNDPSRTGRPPASQRWAARHPDLFSPEANTSPRSSPRQSHPVADPARRHEPWRTPRCHRRAAAASRRCAAGAVNHPASTWLPPRAGA